MKILILHNNYQVKGGEDIVVSQEVNLLKERGHEVKFIAFDNEKFRGNIIMKLLNIFSLFINKSSNLKINKIINEVKPDVIHLHNLFYEITPYIIYQIKKSNIPIVMTIHNYRLVCLSGVLMRKDNYTCELCINKKLPVYGVLYKCFRDSYIESFLLGLVLIFNRIIKTWEKVDHFFVLTEFSKNKLIASGLNLDPNKVSVKPNYVSIEAQEINVEPDTYLFVGRLSVEKGIEVVIESAKKYRYKLIVIGDGGLRRYVEQAQNDFSNITFLGALSHDIVLKYIKSVTAVIIPSLCYEGLPTTILEAYALRTLVICSDQQNLNTIVEANKTGILFKLGDIDDLNKQIENIKDKKSIKKLIVENAFRKYKAEYTKEYVYQKIEATYSDLLLNRTNF